jgi:hypothetical protein
MRLPGFLVALLSSVALACSVSPSTAEESAAADSAPTIDNLACQTDASQTDAGSSSSSFAVTVNADGTVEGALTGAHGISLFNCHAPSANAVAQAPSVVASCSEREQTFHDGRYEIAISKTNGAYAATLTLDDASTAAMTCSISTGLVGPRLIPYEEAKPIIASTCTSCHENTFSTLAKIKTQRPKMLSKLSSGAMPRGQPTFKDSPDGQKLIAFLVDGSEFH